MLERTSYSQQVGSAGKSRRLYRTRRPRRQHKADDNRSTNWLLTFSDLLTLLVTFFAMCLALSPNSFAAKENTIRSSEIINSLGARFATKEAETQHRVKSDPTAILEAAKRSDFTATKSSDSYIIQLPGARLFRSGEDALQAGVGDSLAEIASLVKKFGLRLRIEGHTDDRPIQTSRFRSNWELSVARAIAVLKFFVEHGVPVDHIAAAGRGPYVPIASNETDEGRALNRRVVLIVENPATDKDAK